MTHAEYRAQHPGPGLDPTDCPGELALKDSFAEPPGEPPIEVYRCTACGHDISACGGIVLNDYEDPRPAVRALLTRLADKLRAPR